MTRRAAVALPLATACLLALTLSVAAAAPPASGPAAAPPPDYAASVEQWRAARAARLQREDGWLALVGLHWLKPGDNAAGSAPDAAVPLAAPGVPARAGTLRVEGARVLLTPAPGVALTLNGAPLTAPAALQDDLAGKPDVVGAGRLSFHVVRRGERVGIRVKDPESPTRRGFKGLDWFPVTPAARVVARFTPFDPPREVEVGSVTGDVSKEKIPGALTFTWNGREQTVLPFADGDGFFLVFSDATSGVETYGAARFLAAEAPRDGEVVLDFNKAYNPPCAFTPFATCPLPVRENRLKVRIEAGEKKYRGAGPAGGH